MKTILTGLIIFLPSRRWPAIHLQGLKYIALVWVIRLIIVNIRIHGITDISPDRPPITFARLLPMFIIRLTPASNTLSGLILTHYREQKIL